ncbi:MAG: hypothetical protein KF867_07175 [Cryobacterium sp.]|nr:hypothetical protein [Cryobacterium sp.]
MRIELSHIDSVSSGPAGTTLAVGVLAGPLGPEIVRANTLANRFPDIDFETLVVQDRSFKGTAGSTSRVVCGSKTWGVSVVVLVGLGTNSSLNAIRDATMHLVANSDETRLISLLGVAAENEIDGALACLEGAVLGSYRPNKTTTAKSNDEPQFISAHFSALTSPADSKVEQTLGRAEATNWVRREVETPARELNPTQFATNIVERATKVGLSARIWDHSLLEQNGFGGTLAVGAASSFAPCVVELRNEGVGTRWGLAGKGITFDSGGLNLKKDPAELAWMKSDMAGAAAVAAAAIEAFVLNPKLDLQVILPIAENMPGANALRPGDVVRHPDGRTTEVSDTDSEGRLVLADALAWLKLSGCEQLVDVGTLTDGGGVGPELWGCWGTNEALTGSALAAGERVGDPGWALPLRDSYSSWLESPIADSINAPLDRADTGQTAATFLRAFAGDLPWLHVDNGSNAWQEFSLYPWRVGATGSPTRMLIELLAS